MSFCTVPLRVEQIWKHVKMIGCLVMGRFVCGPKQLTQSSKHNKTLKQSNLPTDQVVQSTNLG